MLLASLILTALSATMIPMAANVPWFLKVTAGSSTINMGMLLSDVNADETFKPIYPGGWCSLRSSISSLSSCSDYETLSFALYIVYHFTFVFQCLMIAACVLHWRSGLVIQGLALTFQSVALFGFFFRVLGMQIIVSTTSHGSVTSWSFGWGAYLAGASLILSFVTCLVFPLTYCVKPPPPPPSPEEEEEGNEGQQQEGQQQEMVNQAQPQQQQQQVNNNNNNGEQQHQQQQQQQGENNNNAAYYPPAQQQQQQQQQQPVVNNNNNNASTTTNVRRGPPAAPPPPLGSSQRSQSGNLNNTNNNNEPFSSSSNNNNISRQ